MKDIFVDANIATRFANPPNQHYKDFIVWLQSNDAWLMISDKLIGEYIGGCKLSDNPTCIGVVLNLKIQQNRYTKISTQQIKQFQKEKITKKVCRYLRSNYKDRFHIPLVLLSVRKMALCNDNNLLYDLLNFPGYNNVTACRTPENMAYK